MRNSDKAILGGVLAGLGAGVLLANALGLGLASGASGYPVPRLIGQGCLGSGGDLWAMDESDFPLPCERIERWPPSE